MGVKPYPPQWLRTCPMQTTVKRSVPRLRSSELLQDEFIIIVIFIIIIIIIYIIFRR